MTEGLDVERILRILPHRWPFVMIDRVTEVVPNARIRGHKCVSMGEVWASGHFAEAPIMPGVLVVEAFAQLGGVLAYASEPFDTAKGRFLLLGVDKVKLRRPVVPGDRLDLEVNVVQRRGAAWRLRGAASVEGALSAEGELLVSVMDGEREDAQR